jgi:hypothetical protein
MSVPPISPVAAALRVQLMAGLEAGLMEALVPINGDKPDGEAADKPQTQGKDGAAGASGETSETETPEHPTAARPAAPAQPATTPTPVARAVAEARTVNAARQAGAAPLFADLAQAAASPALPAPLREAAAQVLATRLPTATPVTAVSVRRAVAASGLFLEARLAAAPPEAAAQTAAQPDLKSALLALRQVLIALAPKAMAQATATPLSPALAAPSTPASSPGAKPLAPPMPAMTPEAPEAGQVLARTAPEATAQPREAQTPYAPPPTTVRPSDVPPPVRQAALAGQAAAAATLPPQAELAEAVPVLRQAVEQALARQTLHQLASTPESAAANPSNSWMFELPMAMPNGGTALAQFEVDRDRRHGGTEGGQPIWRARFTIDVDPLGPVHVHLSLAGGRTTASVWAERPESLALLQDQAGDLARELVGEVVIQGGAPVRPMPVGGQFVDRLS